MKVGSIFLSALALSSLSLKAGEKVLFYDTFDHYGYYVENFNPGVQIAEYPPSLKSLSIQPDNSGKRLCAFKTPMMIRPEVRAVRSSLSFEVKFSQEKSRQLTVHLLFEDNAGGMQKVDANINWNGRSSFSGNGIRPGFTGIHPNGFANIPAFPGGLEQNVEIRCLDGVVFLYLESEGKMVLQGAGNAAPGMKLAGFNFETANSVSLDEIKVCEIAPAKSSVPGFAIAEKTEKLSIPLPSEAYRVTRFAVKTNVSPAEFSLDFSAKDGKADTFLFTPFNQTYTRRVQKEVSSVLNGEPVTEKKFEKQTFSVPDSGMNLSLPNKTSKQIYTKTRLQGRYTEHQIPGILANPGGGFWENASDHLFCFETIRTGDNLELWIDGSFVWSKPYREMENSSLSLSVPAGTEYRIYPEEKRISASPLLVPLYVPRSFLNHNTVMREKDLPPVFRCENQDSFDTAKCRENLGSFFLECDGYLSRTAFDSMPDCFLRSVPPADYAKAYVLCAVDDDPDKSTDVTVRLTQYVSDSTTGRSPNAMTQQTISLPRSESDRLPDGVARLDKNLYLVTVNFDPGRIQDLTHMPQPLDILFGRVKPKQLYSPSHLDFEVLGGLWEKDNYYFSRQEKPALKPSNVHVLGATLEKTPASLFVKSGAVGNIYYPDEEAFMTAEAAPVVPGKYRIDWVAKDVDGNIVWQNSSELDFSNPSHTDPVRLKQVFPFTDYGYFTVNSSLKDSIGNTLISIVSSFVRIAPDTRKAGKNSPFCCWIFAGSHGTISDFDEIGNVMKRQGVYRITYQDKRAESDEQMQRYGLTVSQFPSLRSKETDENMRQKEYDQIIQRYLKQYPGTKAALIFHESCSGPYPQELYGGKTEITPELKKADEDLTKKALEYAHAWRRNAPHIRLVIGNTGSSVGGLARLFRCGFPADLIDTMGEESVGLSSLPEEDGTAVQMWQLEELARIYGYKNLKAEPCFEWKSRNRRHMPPRSAFGIRDALVAMSHHAKTVPLGGASSEYTNCYYNTVWAGANFSRYPMFQPNETVCSVAVFTQVMDCAEYSRMIPTGSQTAYAMEFKRGNEFVYAVWTPRGRMNAAVPSHSAPVKMVSHYGKESELKFTGGKAIVTLTQEPFYLITSVPLNSISVDLQRTYPYESYPRQNLPVCVNNMKNLSQWTLDTREDKRLSVPGYAPYVPGEYAVREVQDEDRGQCMEVTLTSQTERSPLIREYAFLRLNTPAVMSGKPDTLGVWVKGNSGWGKVYFEIEDAEGKVWLTSHTGGYGCGVFDWPGKLSLNFDGWHFLRFPLTAKSSVAVHAPGDNEWQWQCNEFGNKEIVYPVKLRAVGFSMSRKTLVINHIEDLQNKSVRFGGFFAITTSPRN